MFGLAMSSSARQVLPLACLMLSLLTSVDGGAAALAEDRVLDRFIEPEEIGSEAWKKYVVRHVLSNFSDGKTMRKGPQDAAAEFDDLQRAFVTGDGLHFIEPVVRSDRYDDPAFALWQERCPGLEFNRVQGQAQWHWRARPPDHYSGGNLEQLEDIAASWHLEGYLAETGALPADVLFGTRNFRLYEVDISDPPDGQDEVVFTSDAPYSYWRLRGTRGAMDEFAPLHDALSNWNDVVPPQSVTPDQRIKRSFATLINIIDLTDCTVRPLADLIPDGTTAYFQMPRVPDELPDTIVDYGFNSVMEYAPPFRDGLYMLVRWKDRVKLAALAVGGFGAPAFNYGASITVAGFDDKDPIRLYVEATYFNGTYQ